MQPVEALTAKDDREAGTDPDAAAAAYWLRHPEAPRRASVLSDLLSQGKPNPSGQQTPKPARRSPTNARNDAQ
jgi:hypothetical protein